MPIEIRELVIKAVVEENEETRKSLTTQNPISREQVDEIVTLCVNKVMEVIKEKNER